MLLFIVASISRMSFTTTYFKTSYVTVYRADAITSYCFKPISKHRMLLFIPSAYTLRTRINRFQNIVCYCLSFTIDFPRLSDINFKTSYVTVYRPMLPRKHPFSLISKHRMLLFIITHKISVTQKTIISKHRMLLFILNLSVCRCSSLTFQNIVCYCLSSAAFTERVLVLISKHRMLLFI